MLCLRFAAELKYTGYHAGSVYFVELWLILDDDVYSGDVGFIGIGHFDTVIELDAFDWCCHINSLALPTTGFALRHLG